MKDLNAVLDDLIAKGEKATPRPWGSAYHSIDEHLVHAGMMDLAFVAGPPTDTEGRRLNAEYIVAAANLAPKLVRAIKLLLDANEDLRTSMGGHEHWDKEGTRGANCPLCTGQRQARSRNDKTLKQVEAELTKE